MKTAEEILHKRVTEAAFYLAIDEVKVIIEAMEEYANQIIGTKIKMVVYLPDGSYGVWERELTKEELDSITNYHNQVSDIVKSKPISARRTAEGIMPDVQQIWDNAQVLPDYEFKIWFNPYLKELEKYTDK